MRFLVDANLSPRLAVRLRSEGYEAEHVHEVGLLTASDTVILQHAESAGQVIVSADSDFGELLAVSGAGRPSVVLLRSADHLAPDQQARMLAANLSAVASDLDSGAVVSLTHGRLRVRALPIKPTG